MKWVILLMLLAGCTLNTSEPPKMIAPAGHQAVLPLEAPELAVENTTAEIIPKSPTPLPKRPLSLSEQWLEHFHIEFGSYFYVVEDPVYGTLGVFRYENSTKYIAIDELFEIKGAGTVASTWHTPGSTKTFRDKVKHREVPVMNLISYENGTYSGCFVVTDHYRMDQCIVDANDTPIMYSGFRFEPITSPEDWLEEFHGVEPIRIRKKYLYTDKNRMLHTVDYVFYPYDGSIAVLYLHQGYKLPVRVDVWDDMNRTRMTVEYKFFTTDISHIDKEYQFFLKTSRRAE
jgi:hypothetical protein